MQSLVAFLLLRLYFPNFSKLCQFLENNEHTFHVRRANDNVIVAGLVVAVVFDFEWHASTKSHSNNCGVKQTANRSHTNRQSTSRGPCG